MTMTDKALYLHVPFCRHICFYCDFCHFAYNEEKCAVWLDALKKEIEARLDFIPCTIYIGGGTPTSLKTEQLDALLNMLDPFFNGQEYTIEINPETLDEEKTAILKKHGINRASIGVQSTNETELRFLGRNHSFEDVERTVSLLRGAGIENISFDLIYSFEGQTRETFGKSLADCLSLAPNHISVYSLTIEENSVFGIKGVKNLDEDTEADLYEFACNYLSENGFEHYEVANFARPGFRSKHNLCYWHYDDFLGLSAGASSKYDHARYDNTRNFTEYCNGNWIAEKIPLSKKDEMFEMLMMSLRLKEGMSLELFRKRFSVDFLDVFQNEYQTAFEKGLVQLEDGFIYCPRRSILHEALLCFFD
jgi:oxygen-independent coproporphyrinogen-3 oxidase